MNNGATFSAKTRPLAAVLMAAFSAMFVMAGYEFVRNCAASLFLQNFGAGNMPYAMTAVPFAMAAIIYGYGRFLSKAGAMRTIICALCCCSAVFISAYFALLSGAKWVVPLLYIFGEIYIMVLAEQYWAFINSALKVGQAKSYNGLVLGISTGGSIGAGAFIKKYSSALGTEQFIFLAALFMIPAIIFIYAAYRLGGEPQPSEDEKNGRAGHLHISLISKSKMLSSLLFIVFLFQTLTIVINLKFYGLLEIALPLKDAKTAYLGGFWAAVNALAAGTNFILLPF
ncbi:MAG: hypothetical protein NTW04_02120, partial [Elusimicrobia bacterium]|nr:hypothetical protein [Elusimicrobiota bacterium]